MNLLWEELRKHVNALFDPCEPKAIIFNPPLTVHLIAELPEMEKGNQYWVTRVESRVTESHLLKRGAKEETLWARIYPSVEGMTTAHAFELKE